MVVESPETSVRTTSMVESVELEALKIRRPVGDSLYYFHCNEDLLAWRAIGFAARAALELGLHRKTSVTNMFGENEQRQEASRVFWCIYALDRRWSFGTGLPFTIADRDIDPDLLEPDSPHDYLGCLIRYGRLSSNIWEALFSYGKTHGNISDETAESLDMQTAAWLSLVPAHLRLHSSLSSPPGEPEPQPRALRRLRALLHLRANHTRLLIYRHHLAGPACMRNSGGSGSGNKAAVAVAIARDTVAVLADLHATSDIYARQQNGFNYFLVAAVAAIFLAVCHEPDVFAAECRDSFASAVELVRDLSRFSRASRRLWRSVRGLLPRLRRSGIGPVEVADGEEIRDEDQQGDPRLEQLVEVPPSVQDRDQTQEEIGPHHCHGDPEPTLADYHLQQGARGHGELFHYDTAIAQHSPPWDFSIHAYADGSGNEWMPEMVDMSNELMELFKTFEEGQQVFPDLAGDAANMAQAMAYDPMLLTSEEISRRFQDLI
ncbi:proline utilization trans-activator [Microdochium nivale]|nr:proline utilization trans-activator [Microdochium nivale]